MSSMGPKVDNIYTVGDHKIAYLCVNKLEKRESDFYENV